MGDRWTCHIRHIMTETVEINNQTSDFRAVASNTKMNKAEQPE